MNRCSREMPWLSSWRALASRWQPSCVSLLRSATPSYLKPIEFTPWSLTQETENEGTEVNTFLLLLRLQKKSQRAEKAFSLLDHNTKIKASKTADRTTVTWNAFHSKISQLQIIQSLSLSPSKKKYKSQKMLLCLSSFWLADATWCTMGVEAAWCEALHAIAPTVMQKMTFSQCGAS